MVLMSGSNNIKMQLLRLKDYAIKVSREEEKSRERCEGMQVDETEAHKRKRELRERVEREDI